MAEEGFTAAASATPVEAVDTDERNSSDVGKSIKEKQMMHEVNSELDGSPLRGVSTRVALTTFALLLAGPVTLLARPSSQTTFASPEDASRALLAAVQRHDERAVTEILGTKGELVSSGDKLQDTLERDRFVQKYEQMHRSGPQYCVSRESDHDVSVGPDLDAC